MQSWLSAILECIAICEELSFRRKACYYMDKVCAERWCDCSWEGLLRRISNGRSAIRCTTHSSLFSPTRSSRAGL